MSEPTFSQFIQPLNILSCNLLTTSTPKMYELVEIEADVQAYYDNGCDYTQFQMRAIVSLPNGGDPIIIDGFYMQNYTRYKDTSVDEERLTNSGSPKFRVRFSPTMPGIHTFSIEFIQHAWHASISSPTTITRTIIINVKNEIERHGFVTVDKYKRHLKFSDNTSFFPIGHNIPWSNISWNNTYGYEKWMTELSIHGGNFMRVFLGPFWVCNALQAAPLGPKKIIQETSWRLDFILNKCIELDIYTMLAWLDWGDFTTYWYGSAYNSHNYINVSGGNPVYLDTGFVLNARDTLSDSNCIYWFKNRLRYMVARWGAYKHVAFWEVFNELDTGRGSRCNQSRQYNWIDDMTTYVKNIDKYGRPITNSYISSISSDNTIAQLPNLDIESLHLYELNGNVDMIEGIERLTNMHYTNGKPILVTEFSIGFYNFGDYKLYALNESIFSGLFSNLAGVPNAWPWDWAIHCNNAYKVYTPIRDFIKDINFENENFEKSKESFVTFQNPNDTDLHSLLFVTDGYGDFVAGSVSATPIDVNIDGTSYEIIQKNTKLPAKLPGYLHGYSHSDKLNPVTFNFKQPTENCKAIYFVSANSGSFSSTIQVKLNGSNTATYTTAFPDYWTNTGSQNDPSRADHTNFSGVYDYNIPSGTTAVTFDASIDNAWTQISYFGLIKYIKLSNPYMKVMTLKGKNTHLVWIVNMHNTYYTKQFFNSATDIKPVFLMMPFVEQGQWNVKIYNTLDSGILYDKELYSDGEGLKIEVPLFERNIAVKVTKI